MENVTNKYGSLVGIIFGFIFLIILVTSNVHSESASHHRTFMPVVADQTGWIINCVDCPNQIGELASRSAQLDSTGRPHVAYGGNHLYYSYLNSGDEWNSSVLLNQRTDYANLAIDSADLPHIVFWEGDGNLWYAHKDGDNWRFERIPPPVTEVLGYFERNNVSLTIDSLDQPQLSYIGRYEGAAEVLIYAYRDVGGWHNELIYMNSYMNGTSLALDGEDRPYIVTAQGGGLSIIYREESYWINEIVYANVAGERPSLAIGPENYLHIVYMGDNGLNYMLKDESGWHNELIDGESWIQQAFPDVVLDSLGSPHVSYFTSHSSFGGDYHELAYAHRETGSWLRESVSSSIQYPSSSTILVDSPAKAQILWKPKATINLYKREESAWLTEVMERSSYMDAPLSFDFDSTNSPHVIYYDWDSQDFVYSTPLSGTWTSSVVSHEGGPLLCDGCPMRKALSDIAPDDRIHLTLMSTAGKPRYCYENSYGFFDGSTWKVYFSSCTPYSSDLGLFGLDSMNNTHLMDDGKYGYGTYVPISDSYEWNWESAPLSTRFDLAVDNSDRPVLAGTPGLSYAIRTDGGWITTTIYSHYNLDTVLALDPLGQPHFAALDRDQSNSASYIYFDGNSWQREAFDQEVMSLCNPGIAIDDSFNVHLAYVGQGGLTYVFREDNMWHRPKILDPELVSDYTQDICSLELDTSGNPHVIYAYDGDIKITYR